MKKITLSALSVLACGASSASELLYLDASKPSTCVIKTISFPGKEERVLFSEKSCPTALIHDPQSNRFFYVRAKRLWERAGDKVSDWGPLPMDTDSFTFWWQRTTDTLSLAYTAMAEEGDVTREGPEIDRQVSFRFEGKKYKAPGNEGSPAMAILLDRKGGRWVRREVAPTTIESEFAFGLSVLKGLTKKVSDGINVVELRKRSTCGSSEQLKCEGDNPRLAKMFTKDGYGQLPLSTGSLVFAIAFGDSAHASSPVYFCNDAACTQRTKLAAVTEKQLAISKAGNFFFVAEEYSNDAPRVYDMTTKALLWSAPKAMSAVWLTPD